MVWNPHPFYILGLFLVVLIGINGNKDFEFSVEEQAALTKFREAVNGITYLDYQNEDIYLIRWLRAKKLDVTKAKEMLSKSLEWRKKNNIDNILEDTSMLKLLNQLPATSNTFDKDRRPILSVTFGKWDVRKFAIAGKMDQLLRYMSYSYERNVVRAREANKVPGKSVSQWFWLVDMNGYTPRQHACLACVPYYLGLVANFENDYPNSARHIVLINTPRIFEAILQVIRPLFSDSTRRDLQVLGTNKLEWEAVLTNLIPADQYSKMFRSSSAKAV